MYPNITLMISMQKIDITEPSFSPLFNIFSSEMIQTQPRGDNNAINIGHPMIGWKDQHNLINIKTLPMHQSCYNPFQETPKSDNPVKGR